MTEEEAVAFRNSLGDLRERVARIETKLDAVLQGKQIRIAVLGGLIGSLAGSLGTAVVTLWQHK